MSQFRRSEMPLGSVVPLFAEQSTIESVPETRLDLDDMELELVIACGLALRDVADRLNITMEDVCAHLVRFGRALSKDG